jgi:pimeloyl-ACP methyl ester carboxylesterase
MFKRLLIALAVVVIAFVVFAWYRPLTVFHGIRAMQLARHGVKSSYVPVGANRIHFLSGGDGPPLLIIHGVASKAEDSAELLPALMREHRVYAVDLLGYGKSDKPRDASYSIRMHAETIEGFLDAMQIKQADLLGVSMGGWIALDIASRHPARVRKLVLVSSAGLKFDSKLTETSFAPENIQQLREIIALQTYTPIPDFMLRDMLRVSRENSWVNRKTMKTAAASVLDGKLGLVTMPSLLVWGTSDRVVPLPVAERLQKELVHSKLVTLKGCGHLAILECREDALPPIVEFLR